MVNSRPILLVVACVILGSAVAVLPSAEPPPEKPITPADVIMACAADLVSVRMGPDGRTPVPVIDPARARYTRWISIHNIPGKAARNLAARVINGHLHLLSREPDRLPVLWYDEPAVLQGAACAVRVSPWLIRINTLDYGTLFAEQWERLAGPEPYWHADADEINLDDQYEEVEVEYGWWVTPGGTKYLSPRKSDKDTWLRTRVEKERRKKKVVERVHGIAPWVVERPEAKRALEVLQAKTGGTDVPVVTAEWLLFQTAIQKNRNPGYYDFNGIKSLRDFEKLVGFTKEIDPGFLRDIREAVANSTVLTPQTLRRIVRFQAGGAYWFTQDSNQEDAGFNPKASPILNLGDDYVFQAAELFGLKSNRFWATAAMNVKGEPQDTVPDSIASDSTAPYSDRRIHPNLSCLRCHTDGGLQDVNGWVRGVLNSHPNYLANKDPVVVQKLRQQYVTQHLTPHLKADRDQYAAALWEVTGLKPAEFANAYAAMWKTYAEDSVTVERAARDLGTDVRTLQTKLAELGEKCDPNLASFRLPNPRPIPVVLWTGRSPTGSGFQRAQDGLRGVVRPYSIKEKKE